MKKLLLTVFLCLVPLLFLASIAVGGVEDNNYLWAEQSKIRAQKEEADRQRQEAEKLRLQEEGNRRAFLEAIEKIEKEKGELNQIEVLKLGIKYNISEFYIKAILGTIKNSTGKQGEVNTNSRQ